MTGGPREARNVERFPLVAAQDEIARALGAVLRRLAVCESVEEVLRTVVQPVRELLRADGVTFVLREGDSCRYAEEDAIAPLWRGRSFPLRDCISGWCMERSAAVRVPDIAVDPRIPQDAYRATFVRSLAMVPAPQDRPIAAMGAYWARVGDPSEEAIGVLQALANAAATRIAFLRERAERERQEEKARELAHQLRNMSTVIEIIARRSTGESVGAYREALLARLAALREARAELALGGVGTARLDGIARRVLGPLAGAGQLELDGPPVDLPERMATTLGFLLGELGTNAVKHGALSVACGRVRLGWRREGGELCLDWSERGGPPATCSGDKGSGSRFLARAARHGLGGTIEREFGPEGLACRLRFPLPA